MPWHGDRAALTVFGGFLGFAALRNTKMYLSCTCGSKHQAVFVLYHEAECDIEDI
jgi:hypothetical protein